MFSMTGRMISSLAQQVAEALGLEQRRMEGCKALDRDGQSTYHSVWIDFDPEHDWNHLKLVLEEMAERGHYIRIHFGPGPNDNWAASEYGKTFWASDIADIPTAVLEAALKALGGQPWPPEGGVDECRRANQEWRGD